MSPYNKENEGQTNDNIINNKNNNTGKPKSRIPNFDWELAPDEKLLTKFIDNVKSKSIKPTKKEMSIIQHGVFFPGFFIGCAVGVGSFIAMRKVPVYIMNRIMKWDFEHLRNQSKQIQSLNHENGPKPFQEGPALKLIGGIFDAFVASLIGFGAWSLSVDKNKVLNLLSDIPLMEGHSEISNALCSDFIQIYKNETTPKFWKEHTDDTMVAISKFVRNCEKRQIYQREIRREKGLMDVDVVDIELPSRVPDEEMLVDIDDADDWAALEDFDDNDDRST